MASGEEFQVDLEAVGSSAAHVTGQSEDLATTRPGRHHQLGHAPFLTPSAFGA
jgi:hypothetical protein